MPCTSPNCVNALQTTLDGFRSRPGVPTDDEKAVLDRLATLLARERRTPTRCLLDDACVRRGASAAVPAVPGVPEPAADPVRTDERTTSTK